MARTAAIAFVLAAFAGAALGDTLVLTDGRTFTGTVTVEDQNVRIEMAYGTLRFPRDQVERIDFKATPEAELAKRLSETPLDNPDALFELAQWARKNALDRQADDLVALVLKLNPEHAGARRDAGFVKIEGKWESFDQALRLANNKLDAGRADQVLKDMLPAMEEAAGGHARAIAVKELLATAQLRNRDFAQAAKTYADLGAKADAADAPRFAAVAEILNENPDGMYVLTEPDPPAAGLTGDANAAKPGPASLSEPMVLLAALRDRARKLLDAGKKSLDEAKALDPTDPDAAKAKFLLASQSFDKADSLVADISKSYRIEVVRLRIASVRKQVAAQADKYDKDLESLGQKNLAPAAYHDMVQRMVRRLDTVRENLQSILAMSRPYPRDLVLEISWAQADLKKIGYMRDTLLEELGNGEK